MNQPVPQLTSADVKRVVARDFSAGQQAAVHDILRAYGDSDGAADSARVHLAVLKLAAGDVQRLREYVETARQDYRDVLAWADYSRYMHAGSTWSLPEAQRQAIIEADWQEYQAWLQRE